jgi:ABC-2 type transport system ATP-binding protein
VSGSRGAQPIDGSPAILIEHAKKAYGRTAVGRAEAVSDVSLSVSRGAIHGLLGPNGAGKTTTLKMLLGLVRPTSGRVEILGNDARRPSSRRGLGFLPEQPYFPQQLTAGEALSLYGALGGYSNAIITEQTPELLERVGLEGREKTLLSKFSRGMLQRLGLAQALLGSPEVVVLDEPASGLDPVGQRDVRAIMLDMQRDGVTILLSSHQLSEVEAVCDEVTILNRGLVAARGQIHDLLSIDGQVSVRARGDGELPAVVSGLVSDHAITGATSVFSVPEESVRAVVDALDDAGWRLESMAPKRESLEDYFARLLERAPEEVSADE